MNEAERFLQQYEQKTNPPSSSLPQPPPSVSTPVQSTRAVHSNGSSDPGLLQDWWSLSGRIGRKTYVLRHLIIVFVVSVCVFVLGFPLLMFTGNETSFDVLVAIVSFTALAFAIPQHTRRLHDIGLSGWFQLIMTIPLIGLGFGIFLYLKSGTPGPNKYDLDTAQEAYS